MREGAEVYMERGGKRGESAWREEVEEGEVGMGGLKVEGRINNIYT